MKRERGVIEPRCQGCNMRPFELICYISMTHSRDPEVNDRYVRSEEGTYNPVNGHFLCDACYIKAGMPTAPGGWRCP